LTLALGIAAANAAIFTLINSVLPKNLAVVYLPKIRRSSIPGLSQR
jgi:hypothetical protein